MNQFKLSISTTNQNKLKEISQIFSDLSIPIISSYSLYPDINVEENSTTFQGNAALKVTAFPNSDSLIYVGEDSGLVVPALNGEPGIYSARYAGPNATAEQLCAKVLKNLSSHKNRSAYFICCIAVQFPSLPIQYFTGKIDGKISYQMQGTHGFGYDPIFIPCNYTQTFSELGVVIKNELSHRFNAFNALKPVLKSFLAKNTFSF